MKPTYLLALGVFLTGVVAASPTAAQKPAPLQPTEQQKLKKRVDTLESQLKEAQAKADRAAMEKDYIERTQKEAKDYYEKAFETQVKFLEWVIILIAAVPIVVGLFGYSTIDRIIEHTVSKATTDVERKFDEKLAAVLKTLKDSNAGQTKQLQSDFKVLSDYQFNYGRGLAAFAADEYKESIPLLREAVRVYKSGRERGVIEKKEGIRTINNLFVVIAREDTANATQNGTQELQNPLYDDLEDELAYVALEIDWLSPLVKERKQAGGRP
jgi:hypothetical protein